MQQWHAVSVTGDSISGVPYVDSPNCAGCRVSMSRVMVDSVRLGNPVAGFWKTMGLALGAMVLALAAWGGDPGN